MFLYRRTAVFCVFIFIFSYFADCIAVWGFCWSFMGLICIEPQHLKVRVLWLLSCLFVSLLSPWLVYCCSENLNRNGDGRHFCIFMVLFEILLSFSSFSKMLALGLFYYVEIFLPPSLILFFDLSWRDVGFHQQLFCI